METDTLRRFDRLVAILIQLQSKRIVKAQEMADRFQVSLRTIYRDLKTLEQAGVPLYGEAGSGYALVEGYRLPPVMFTREEAGSFLAAEKLMEQFSDQRLGQHFQSALYKIKSVLRGKEKDWLDTLNPHISVYRRQPVFNATVPNAFELLMDSLAEKQQIVLQYQSLNAEEPAERAIEPVGLFHENQFWYLLAYCHLRKDYRQFRLDRIHGIAKSERPFTRAHGTVEQYRDSRRKRVHRTSVRLLVEPEVVRYLASNWYFYGYLSEQKRGERVELLFEVPVDEGFIRWLLMFADYIEVLAPEEVRLRLQKVIANMIRHQKMG